MCKTFCVIFGILRTLCQALLTFFKGEKSNDFSRVKRGERECRTLLANINLGMTLPIFVLAVTVLIYLLILYVSNFRYIVVPDKIIGPF